MRVVFAHQNFPAQFGEFGSHLAQLGWDVAFLTAAEGFHPPTRTKGVRATANRKPSQEIHSLARPMERAMINGHAMGTAAMKLQKSGFEPDVMVAHSGWGSGSLLKAVWPKVPFVPYIEWFYRSPPTDALNEKERTPSVDQRASAMSRNAPILLDLAQADIAICPTYFQAEQLPERHRGMLRILHDGVDAERNAPDPQAKMQVPGLDLSAAKEVVTYATRGMEPHRGFPEFMRALERLQKSRPSLHAVIGGEDRICYGRALPDGETWKGRMLKQLDLDLSRIHFVGLQQRGTYRNMLQSTDLHLYLTVPFVLSWSLLEAMSVAAPIVASNTAPVLEAMDDGVHGRLVDHTDIDALVAAMTASLDNKDAARRMGLAARERVLERYDRNWLWPARAALLRDAALGTVT